MSLPTACSSRNTAAGLPRAAVGGGPARQPFGEAAVVEDVEALTKGEAGVREELVAPAPDRAPARLGVHLGDRGVGQVECEEPGCAEPRDHAAERPAGG